MTFKLTVLFCLFVFFFKNEGYMSELYYWVAGGYKKGSGQEEIEQQI